MITKLTKKDLAELCKGIKETTTTSSPDGGHVEPMTPVAKQIPKEVIDVPQTPLIQSKESDYAGDAEDHSTPVRDGEYQTLDFLNPAELVATYDKFINSGEVKLHKWQKDASGDFAPNVKPTSNHPLKYVLCAANGSGKDKYVIAPFVIWFAISKIKSRAIITSSSGIQLTSQTEAYIRDLAETINAFHGEEIFRIKQRFIKCRLSGSEIRMFATDEAGKAEGYHPIEPNAEMAIIVNEAKSVATEIFGALRRCTGYNYWLDVSTPGEPVGDFYNHFTSWKHTRHVTFHDCPHLSQEDYEEDKRDLGEHSALFRSKHLALFTSLGGSVIITQETIERNRKYPVAVAFQDWPTRVGIDLAAGGDENVITISRGNAVLNTREFREVDTTITADIIEDYLKQQNIKKDSEYIFADDGGVGHAIIDMLKRKGWNIKRVINQSAAFNKTMYGNRGAENWYRIARLFEENVLVIPWDNKKLLAQLYTRRYKQNQGSNNRLLLESKKDAKAEGRPSPDRADSFILSFHGLRLDDFLKQEEVKKETRRRGKIFHNQDELYAYGEEQTYASFNPKELTKHKHCHMSLHNILDAQSSNN